MSEIKTINIKGKAYVEVAERVRLVHDQKRAFEVVESEPYAIGDRTLWRVTILVDEKKYKGNAEVKLGAKSGPDSTNPFECAETSALGRALAFAGLGTVESIASFDEVARAIISQNNQNEPTPRPQPVPRPIQNAPASTSKSQQNESSAPTTPTPNNVAPINSAPSKLPPQTRALQDMIGKAKARAEKLGVNWEDEKGMVLGKVTSDLQLTVQNVAAINGDLTKAEKQAS